MVDELSLLVNGAERLVSAGYYRRRGMRSPGRSLARALRDHPSFPLIAEVKLASPSSGKLSAHSPEKLLSDYKSAGAAAVSVLTEPERFGGSLGTLDLACGCGLPVLMKDFVISEEQVDAAASLGSSAVLLIQEVFDGARPSRRDVLIARAHEHGLEVLLEAGGEEALRRAASSEADLLGINQRDLRTLTVDRGKAERLLPMVSGLGRLVVVMSGIDGPVPVARARDLGAGAVLVGGHLASSSDPRAALRSLAVPR
jgi:indole-3-glycerol phosphate synthase